MKKLFKGKKKFIVGPLLLALVAGGVYKVVFVKPPPPPKKKIEGSLVPLEREFLINLADGRYGKLSLALVVEGHGAGGHGAAPVALPQEGAIRSIVTDTLTGAHADELVDRHERHVLLQKILKTIKKKTDEHVEEVLVTDLTVQ